MYMYKPEFSYCIYSYMYVYIHTHLNFLDSPVCRIIYLRERERERERESVCVCNSDIYNIYIHTYIHTYIHMGERRRLQGLGFGV